MSQRTPFTPAGRRPIQQKVSILSFLLALVLSGCVSSAIIQSGKSHTHLYKPKVTMAKVHRSIGEPVYSKHYDQPTPIEETDEYKAFETAHKDIFIWGGDKRETDIEMKGFPKTKTVIASYCEVFVNHGPFEELIRGEVYGMAAGLTLGLSEFYFVPVAIKERWELSKLDFYKTFWFDETKKFLAVFNGDIRDLKKKYYP